MIVTRLYRTVVCPLCTETARYGGRGLCKTCYDTHHAAGTHIDFPRRYRPLAETVEEYDLLRSAGMRDKQIAEQLGIKPKSLKRALLRYRTRSAVAA